MKMLTTVSASVDGVIDEILLKKGQAADTGDLLVIVK
jgi:biotin carboxyl carrier protein